MMDKAIRKIEIYIFEFFSTRFHTIDTFFRATHRDRHTGIYKLKEGTKLMDFLITIHGKIQDCYYCERLIPHNYASPEALFSSFDHFKNFLNVHQKLLDINHDSENPSYIIEYAQALKDELIVMIDYVKKIWDLDDNIVPYQDLRYFLITRNIPEFVRVLKSILASVSYAINKVQEGYYHSNIHLILKLLGFEILAEDTTNLGRIDAVIKFSDTIYLVEFKFNKEQNLSKEALRQIKETKYADKFLYEKKDIFGIGISFSEKERNINAFLVERLTS